jgi:hypothetical protein
VPQATDYLLTLKAMLEVPSIKDIVKDPMGTPVPTKADLQMLLAYELAGRVEPDEIGPVVQFMSKRDASGHGMPKDQAITFTKSLMRRDARSFMNKPAMQQWISRNAYLVSIIGSLA